MAGHTASGRYPKSGQPGIENPIITCGDYPMPTGITLEDVWKLFRETDQKFRETDRKLEQFEAILARTSRIACFSPLHRLKRRHPPREFPS